MFSWQISWRSLRRRKLRALLAFTAIAIGVSTMMAVMVSLDTASRKIRENVQEFNRASGFFVRGTDFTFADSLIASTSGMQGVDYASALLAVPARVGNASLPDYPASNPLPEGIPVVINGTNLPDRPPNSYRVLEGSLAADGLFVEEGTAKLWGVTSGSSVSVAIDGKTHSVRIAAVVGNELTLGGPGNWEDARYWRFFVAARLDWLQSLSGMDDRIQQIEVVPDEGKQADVALQLEAIAGARNDIYIEYRQTDEAEYNRGMNDLQQGFYALAALGMLMCAVILFTSLYVGVIERRREFAIMKSLGMTSGQISLIVFRETLLLALCGTITGLAAGVFLSHGLTAGVLQLLHFQSAAELSLAKPMMWSAIMGICLSLLAAAIPLYEASRTSVAQAFRTAYEERPIAARPIAGISGLALLIGGLTGLPHWFSSIVLFVGLLLVYPAVMRWSLRLLTKPLRWLFGYEGFLAVRQLSRRMTRTALAAAILCTGLSFLILSGFVSASIQQTIATSARQVMGGDINLFVSTPLLPADLDALRQIPGVREALAYREVQTHWLQDGRRKNLSVTEVKAAEAEVPKFVARDGRSVEEVKRELQEPGTIALSSAAWRSWGGRIGEKIELNTPDGIKPFKVVAVVTAYNDGGHTGFIAETRFEAAMGVKFSRNAVLLTQSPADAPAVRSAVAVLFAERLTQIQSSEQFAADMLASNRESFVILNAILAFIVLVSGIGILNTLTIDVAERMREIGMMRAVASTKRQIRLMIVAEGLFIGLIGAITGILLGAGITYAIIVVRGEMGGFPLTLAFSWQTVGFALLFGFAVGGLSGLLPASRAASADLAAALKYE